MKLNKALNLVIPLEGDDGTFYVHATSISRQVFEQFFIVISKAFSSIYTEGLNLTAGPRVAAMMIRKVAEEMGAKDEVENGLINEMKRLTNVVMVGANGWQTISLHEATTKGLLAGDELSEVENALAFFSLVSVMHRKIEREEMLKGACRLWGGLITSSSCTEWSRSLPTSTETEPSGVTNPV